MSHNLTPLTNQPLRYKLLSARTDSVLALEDLETGEVRHLSLKDQQELYTILHTKLSLKEIIDALAAYRYMLQWSDDGVKY